MWSRAGLWALIAGAFGFLATTAGARVILDRNDPAFAGATSIPLPPAGLAGAALSFTFAVNGESIGLQSTSNSPLLNTTFPGGIFVRSSTPTNGVTVSLSPQVTAIGFTAAGIDGCPGGSFVGTTGTDSYESPFPCSSVFFGAADIGPIGVVNLRALNSLFRVTEILVVIGGAPVGNADLSLFKSTPTPRALQNSPIRYQMALSNSGPTAAQNANVIDFLPEATYVSSTPAGTFDDATSSVRFAYASVANGAALPLQVDLTAPLDLTCESALTNIAVATSATPDPALANNLATSTIYFDRGAVAGNGEICGNGRDDNCDGRYDCGDSSCDCHPVLPSAPGAPADCSSSFQNLQIIEGLEGQTLLVGGACDPEEIPAESHVCHVPRGRCHGVDVPAWCCDPATWSNPSLNGSAAIHQCDLGIPGCVPFDPNFKQSDPTVNIAGYGQTDAGRLMTYAIHYENIGTGDALNVEVIDVLEPDLDVNTLSIDDGGLFDPATRTIVWIDAVVPPHDPRIVTFSVRVRADAPPGTRVRNVATIVFPNAVPPSRVDTEFIEHVVVDPNSRPAPRLHVKGCTQTSPGQYAVQLVNDGGGFAYNTRALILSWPGGVVITDLFASFAHPNDVDRTKFATVIPGATTTSYDGVAFNKVQPGDPCPTFTWQISYENIQGAREFHESQSALDDDRDGVPDPIDNCPGLFNPQQIDTDGDGHGNGCEVALPCDVDGDFDVDKNDTAQITAARNQSAYGPEDPRDRDADGIITVLDARKCVLECTRARCATQ